MPRETQGFNVAEFKESEVTVYGAANPLNECGLLQSGGFVGGLVAAYGGEQTGGPGYGEASR
jgi:hypothetical protein